VPIRVWLRDDKYYGIIKDVFTSQNASQFFNTDKLVSLLDRHKSGEADCSRKIWTVYSFLVWYGVYFG
jgi:asparagine synthase (glutamine-hydrolysing)